MARKSKTIDSTTALKVALQSIGVLKSFASTLRTEAREYDCRWPLSIAADMEDWAKSLQQDLKG